jgi:hypothetical protein
MGKSSVLESSATLYLYQRQLRTLEEHPANIEVCMRLFVLKMHVVRRQTSSGITFW